MTADIDEKDFLKTLARGLALIKSFSAENSSMTLSQVARINNMSRASARRFLLTLKHLGYVHQKENKFRLTAKILDIGSPYLSNLNFIETITPYMREISRELGKACSAAVLNDLDIVYVVRIPSKQILSINLNVGSRLPAYCTSMGRVLLSGLGKSELDDYFSHVEIQQFTKNTITSPAKLRQEIRKVEREGYAFVDQELELSLRSLAVPVHDRLGNVICAINVGMPVDAVEIDEAISTYIPVLRNYVTQMEAAIAPLPAAGF